MSGVRMAQVMEEGVRVCRQGPGQGRHLDERSCCCECILCSAADSA